MDRVIVLFRWCHPVTERAQGDDVSSREVKRRTGKGGLLAQWDDGPFQLSGNQE